MPDLEPDGLQLQSRGFYNFQLSSFSDLVPTVASYSCSWLMGT